MPRSSSSSTSSSSSGESRCSDDSNYSNSSSHSYSSAEYDTYAELEAELEGSVVAVGASDHQFEEYLKNVYGLIPEDIEYVKNKVGGWVLNAECLAEFQQVIADHGHKAKLHAPFKGMVDAFYTTMESDRIPVNVHLRTLGAIGHQPDGLFLLKSVPADADPTWAASKAYLEIYSKKRPRRMPVAEPASSPTPSSMQTLVGSESSSIVNSGVVPNADSRSRSSSRREQLGANVQESPGGDDQSRAGSKRKSSSDEASTPCKRVKITRKTCQSASYALELLSATPRRWSTGLVVEGSEVTIKYFDRCGGIVTPPFDFIKEPTKLALVLLAIGTASLTQAGYDSYFVLPDSHSLEAGLPPITDGHLILPPLGNTDADGLYTGSKDPDDSWSRFAVEEHPLYVYSGLKGRGSIVWSGTWKSKEASTDGGDNKADPVPAVPKDDDALGQIAKLSWPNKDRPRHEPKILEDLFEKVPSEMHEHFPQLRASVLMTADVAGLPRVHFINQATGNFKKQFELGIRHFAIMVVDRYRHLWHVDTVEEFENIYVDLVKGHYYAYRYAGILHRDLSENNVMWKRKNGEALGVLIDWDLASPVDEAANDTGRTGTVIFMAMDILWSYKRCGHHYHHDLESLFYILIWAMTHYELGPSHRRRQTCESLRRWGDDDFDTSANAKCAFLTNPWSRKGVFDSILPVFQPLVNKWLIPLRKLFCNAIFAKSREGTNFSESITYEAYMKILQPDERLTEPTPLPPSSSPSSSTA
ncbi:hypothetical protein ONZ45_g11835 [Pleurotus djamor]|nr:hypothetical protein ONZ45_g11835 [Pleurotus djamor]